MSLMETDFGITLPKSVPGFKSGTTNSMAVSGEAGASQLAVEAHEAAIDEVCRLLQSPEDLARLPALRSEYEQKRQVNKAKLTALVQSHVEATRSGMEILERAQKSVLKLRACFEQIDRLCNECTSLIENHEKIQVLSVAHHNVTKTLDEIDNIIDLPSNAEIAEEMLEDDNMLVEAFKALTVLEGTSRLVQDAMKSNHRRRDEMQNLNEYFDKVKDTLGKFEAKLWANFRNFHALGKHNPGLLVACVHVVELQETITKELGENKKWKIKALVCMEDAIQDRFKPLFEHCETIATVDESEVNGHEEEGTRNTGDVVIPDVLDGITGLVGELAEIYDYVGPCFPANYDVFKTLWSRYHLQFASLLDSLGLKAHQISNREILSVIQWVEGYLDTLRGLGIEEEELKMPKYPVLVATSGRPMEQSGLSLLIDMYVLRFKESTTTWYLNIIESDISREPNMGEDGKLWSPGVVDFFRILNDAISCVEDVTRGELLYQLANSALAVMKDFVQSQIAVLQREISFEMLCAFSNNNIRCYDLSIDFVENVEEMLAEEVKGKLEVEEVCKGFLGVGKLAMKKLVEGIYTDPGMVDLLKKLYQGSEWQEGHVTATFIATLEDYFRDFRRFLDPSIFKRIAESACESAVSSFTSGLMNKLPPITEEVVHRMQEDEDAVRTFFCEHVKPEKVGSIIRTLTDLRNLACSDSIDAFVLSYSAILDANVNTQPVIVERICAARQGMTRQDVQEVVELCREVYVQRQKVSVAEQHAQNKAQAQPTTIWQRWRELL